MLHYLFKNYSRYKWWFFEIHQFNMSCSWNKLLAKVRSYYFNFKLNNLYIVLDIIRPLCNTLYYPIPVAITSIH